MPHSDGRPESLPADLEPAGTGAEVPGSSVKDSSQQLTAKRLANGAATLDGLCEVVLSALRARDAATLESLRVTEKEYREHLFPEFPQAGPGNTIPVDFHWFHLDTRSKAGLGEALEEFGGVEYELLEAVVTQGVEQLRTYRIHKKVELKVRRQPDGEEAQIKVFGSVVEMDGEFKIVGFPT